MQRLVEAEDVGEGLSKLLTLPTELLALIFSFVGTIRDKIKIRYVSRRLRSVMETPSLWREFVWPYYDDREELSINIVLRTCGKYVKRMSFPDHVPPLKLANMLQYCGSVTHLNLPKGTQFSARQLKGFVEHMEKLQYLNVHWGYDNIKPLLSIGTNLKELTVYVTGRKPTSLYPWLQAWMEDGCMPQNLNLVVNVSTYFVLKLIDDWSQCNLRFSPNRIATLKIYTSLNIPLSLIPPVPVIQLQYGPTATLPFTNASKFGMLGLKKDLLLLTDSCNGDRTVYKAVTMSTRTFGEIEFDLSHCKLIDLKFLTCFEATICNEFHSGHLEQLAIACPNLEQLKLLRNHNCLKRLQGLRSIADHCKKLQGLNLLGIPVINVESQVCLWEILCNMKLTHLAVDLCMLKHNDVLKERASYLFSQCSVLQALEMYNDFLSCCECEEFVSEDFMQLSHFPMLSFCNLTRFDFHCSVVHNIVTSCNKLCTLNIHCSPCHFVPPQLTVVHSSSLKQLCLSSHCAVITGEFMEAVSAHGGLEHVIFIGKEITFGGIVSLVMNSPLLVTFRAAILQALEQDGIANLRVLKTTLMEMFPQRKLFTMGSYLVEKHEDLRCLSYDLLSGTDFKSTLWPKSIEYL